MFVTALCPTFRHPDLLANSLALWNMQQYPAEQRRLIILDDAQTFDSQHGHNWQLVSLPKRCHSLPDKYNIMVALAPRNTDVFVVWEDDDIFLPHHISAHVRTIQDGHEYSKPTWVAIDTNKPGEIIYENHPLGTANMHGSSAFTADLLRRVGGYPNTNRADYDLQMITELIHKTTKPVGNSAPIKESMSFIMGWHTGAWHGQLCHLEGPSDEHWYERAAEKYAPVEYVGKLEPKLDARTEAILKQLGRLPDDHSLLATQGAPPHGQD